MRIYKNSSNTARTNKSYTTSRSTDAWDSLNFAKEVQDNEETQMKDHGFFPSDDEDDDMDCVFFGN